MPIDQDLLKVTFGGLINGVQTWSSGFWCTPGAEGPVTQSDLNRINNDVGVIIGGQAGGFVGNLQGNSTNLRFCRTYHFPPSTSTSDLVSTDHAFTNNGSGDSMPSLLACVASLRSETPGRSGRGRMYLPLTKVAAMDATGQITDTVCTNVAAAWATILSAVDLVDGAFGGLLQAVVASFTTGNVEAITRVVVNSIADIQHRREDQLVATTNASHALA
jgi:hypothetical protein